MEVLSIPKTIDIENLNTIFSLFVKDISKSGDYGL